jgi:hypothetical protein
LLIVFKRKFYFEVLRVKVTHVSYEVGGGVNLLGQFGQAKVAHEVNVAIGKNSKRANREGYAVGTSGKLASWST